MRDGRRWVGGRSPLLVDSVLAAGMAGVTVLLGYSYPSGGFRPFDGLAVLLTCLAHLPLAVRRRAAAVVSIVVCVPAAWFLALGYFSGLNLFAPLLALYTVVAQRSPRTALPGAVATTLTIFYSGIAVHLYPVTAAASQAAITTAVAWVFGAGARRLADRNQRLMDLTEQLRHEREERARTAVVEERLRLARELHDVVAHHMSVISVQSGLARYVLGSDQETVRNALGTISDTSHEALEEMRRLLAVLRVSPGDLADDGPAPGLSRLDDLVDRMVTAGVPVEVETRGEPWELPSGADLCAYRVIQESLTNVLKHAPDARVRLVLDYRSDELEISVRDDGREPIAAGSAGHGLVGMRERAALYGGTMAAGPDPAGGFAVRLLLPGTTMPRS